MKFSPRTFANDFTGVFNPHNISNKSSLMLRAICILYSTDADGGFKYKDDDDTTGGVNGGGSSDDDSDINIGDDVDRSNYTLDDLP